jgi:hypothetical protein
VHVPALHGLEVRTIVVEPPGTELARRMAATASRARHRYLATIGIARGWRPRARSLVEHRVPLGAEAAVEALRERGQTWSYDDVRHEHGTATVLRLRWSWPPIPMWLAVGELSRNRCALRLSLRSHHRWRYPLRYFDAAHTMLVDHERRITAARAAPPPAR